MKRKLIVFLTLCFISCVALSGLTACENLTTEHKHVYNKRVVSEIYLEREATCVAKARYYYSCECGDISNSTFEQGELGKHYYSNWVCNDNGTHTRVCMYKESHTETNACNGGTAACEEKAVCIDCGGQYGEPLYHNYGAWASNGDGTHTKTCSNDSTHSIVSDCNGGVATETERAVCVGCGAEYGATLAHTHKFDQQKTTLKFLMSSATCTEKAKYYVSCSCGEKGSETFEFGDVLDHVYGEFVSNGDGTHTKTCANDSTHKITASCNGGTATCTEKATCVDCGGKYGDFEDHNYTKQVIEDNYKASGATCTVKAQYFYSCECGAKGIATFEYGELAKHYTDSVGYCFNCQQIVPYIADCLFVNNANAVLANSDECNNIADVKITLAENGIDATQFKPLTSGAEFFWNGNCIVLVKDCSVVYPENLKGNTDNGNWFSLSGEGNKDAVTTLEAGSLTAGSVLNMQGASVNIDKPADGYVLGSTNENSKATIKNVVSDEGSKVASNTGKWANISYYAGMFGVVDAGKTVTVKNLVIDGAVIGNTLQPDSARAGIIAGQVNGTLIIENVTIKNSTVFAEYRIGALVGAVASNASVVIKNVTFENVTVKGVTITAALIGQVGKNATIEITNTTTSGIKVVLSDFNNYEGLVESECTTNANGDLFTKQGYPYLTNNAYWYNDVDTAWANYKTFKIDNSNSLYELDCEFVDNANAVLATITISEANIFTAFDALAEAGMDAQDYKALSSGMAFYWDSEINRILMVETLTNTVVYPMEYVGRTNTGKWFSLTQEIKTESATISNGIATVTNAGQLLDVVDMANNGTEVREINLNSNNINMMGAALTIDKVAANKSLEISNGTIVNATAVEAKIVTTSGTINSGNDGIYNMGMITKVEKGATVTLSNVTIKNMNLKDTNAGNCGFLVGTLCGKLILENVTIEDSSIIGYTSVGSLVGYLTSTGSIEIKGTLTIKNVSVQGIGGRIGQLIGYADNAITDKITLATGASVSVTNVTNTIYSCEQNTGACKVTGCTHGALGLDGNIIHSWQIDGKDGLNCEKKANRVFNANSLVGYASAKAGTDYNATLKTILGL